MSKNHVNTSENHVNTSESRLDTSDSLQRFLFEESDIRGQVVTLDNSIHQLLSIHHYPKPVEQLLSEALCAVVLMSSTLKFEGSLSLQIQGDGPLRLLHAQATHKQDIRGIARFNDNTCFNDNISSAQGFKNLVAKGQMVITIEPTSGKRYQGIVPIDGNSLAECLSHYFEQSEQLATRFEFHIAEQQSFGLMLQQMPTEKEGQANHFEHLGVLLNTLKDEEMASLPAQNILTRLFHAEQLRLYPATPVAFSCSCSRERTLAALLSIGQNEIEQLLSEKPQIEMTCEYCNTRYTFDKDDLGSGNDTVH